MMPRSFLHVPPLALAAICASAAIIGANIAALPLTEERIVALPGAQQNAWREYLARSVAQMQADRAVLPVVHLHDNQLKNGWRAVKKSPRP
jgi:hypothetical protein